MKKIILSSVALIVTTFIHCQPAYLDRTGKNAILMVDGKPFIMLSGELHNSSSSSIEYLNGTWDKLTDLNLNSVIASASWELVEPEEGHFDFSHVDAIIEGARQHNMKVALIWFGTFKNPFMTYAPYWVKTNPRKYPRARDPQGNDLEHPTLFDDNIIKADKKAYLALLKHIKEVDRNGTIIMIQIGNEPGLRVSTRDCSPSAEKVWKANVPRNIIDYLVANKGTLQPDVELAWKENGYKTSGNWETVFGKSLSTEDGSGRILHLTEHLFTAYAYARYLEELSSAGKEIHPLPTFTNATGSVNSRGRSLGNGCSIPDFFDIYRAVAPSLDILAPNSYGQNLDKICEAFAWKGNPILVPESGLSGVRPLYLIGEWDALCFSPFGIDHDAVRRSEKENDLFRQANSIIQNMWGLVTSNLNSDKMRGVYIYQDKPSETIEIGNYSFTFSRRRGFDIGAIMAPVVNDSPPQGTQATAKTATPAGPPAGVQAPREPSQQRQQQGGQERFMAGGLVIQTADNEFYIVGSGINADIKPKPGVKHRFSGFISIHEGKFENDKFIPGRLFNGDERSAYLDEDKIGVLKVKMYYY